jgi:uncharacterized protein (DUF2141 family)
VPTLQRRLLGRRFRTWASITSALLLVLLGLAVTPAAADTVTLRVETSVIVGTTESTTATIASGSMFRILLKYTCVSTSSPCRNVEITSPIDNELQVLSVSTPNDVAIQAFENSRVWPPNTPPNRQHNASGLLRLSMVDPLSAGSTGQVLIQAQFPIGYTPNGTRATVRAQIRGTNAATFTANTSSVEATAQKSVYLYKSLVGGGAAGGTATYEFNVCHRGNLAVVDNSFVDTLPDGAEVIPDAAVTEPSPGLAKISFEDLNGTCTRRQLRVRFPDGHPSNTVGASKTNVVEWQGRTIGDLQPSLQATASATHVLSPPIADALFSKYVSTPRYEPSFGQLAFDGETVSYNLTADTTRSNSTVDRLTIEDTLPVAMLATGYSMSADFAPIELLVSTNRNPSFRLWQRLETEATTQLFTGRAPSGILLQNGEEVLAVRFISDSYAPHSQSVTVNAKVRTGGGTPALSIGDAIDNQASLRFDVGSESFAAESNARFMYRPETPAPNKVAISSYTFYSASTRELFLSLYGSSNSGANRGVENLFVSAVLPVGVSLDRWQANVNPSSQESIGLTQYPLGDGRTLVVWRPLDPQLSLVSMSVSAVLFLEATVQGSITPVGYAGGDDSTGCVYQQSLTDTQDVDHDADITELVCESAAPAFVDGGASAVIESAVQGSLDSAFQPAPGIGRTNVQSADRFRVTVRNTSPYALRDVVMVDMLPRPSDGGVLNVAARRNTSDASPVLLTGPVQARVGDVVSYSTVSNPCRTEVGYEPSGCVTANWSTTLPGDPATVTAVKVAFAGQLAAGSSFDAVLPVTMPTTAVAEVSSANSAAFVARRVDNLTALLPSESQKANLIVTTGSLRVGDRVFLDRNANRSDDAGEPGLAGVPVRIWSAGSDAILGNANDVLQATTVTNATGAYEFANLTPGNYLVQVLQVPNSSITALVPVNLYPTVDPDGGSDHSATVILTTANVSTLDFGYAPRTIGNFVWNDLDADGIQDANEPGIDGAMVFLREQAYIVGSTMTGDNPSTAEIERGWYSFEPLIPGRSYELSVAKPGFVSTRFRAGTNPQIDNDFENGRTRESLVVTGATRNIDNLDAGLIETSSLGELTGSYWLDEPADGLRNGSEAGFGPSSDSRPGYVYLVELGADGVLQGGDDTYVSIPEQSGDGFRVQNLVPGNYQLQFSSASGGPAASLVPTAFGIGTDRNIDSDIRPDSGSSNSLTYFSQPFTVTPGGAPVVIDIGLKLGLQIGDRVWLDVDGDGIQDTDEPGVQYASLTLHDFGPDGIKQPIVDTGDGVYPTGDDQLRSTNTDANGCYQFTGLLAHKFEIKLQSTSINEIDYRIVPRGLGSDGERDSDFDPVTRTADVIDLTSGASTDRIDAGLRYGGTASVGNYVFADLNSNGIQDPTDGPISAILYLEYLGPDGLPQTNDEVRYYMVSDTQGRYRFSNLPAGKFLLFAYNREYQTTGANFLTDFKQGTDPAVDSDVDPATFRSAIFELGDGESRNDLDVGYVDGALFGRHLWVDENSDGIRQVDELPLSNGSFFARGAGPDDVFETTDDSLLGLYGSYGTYQSYRVRAGRYRLEAPVVISSGSTFYRLTTARAGTDQGLDSDPDETTGIGAPFTMAAGQTDFTHDVGYRQGDGSIGNVVWRDVNANGTQEVGEPGVANAQVQIRWAGFDGVLNTNDDVVNSRTTNSLGYYQFTGLPAGTYRLRVNTPYNFSGVLTRPSIGTDREADSDFDESTMMTAPFLLGDGEFRGDIDAGFVTESSLGDRVFLDVNRDGIDNGEPGVRNVLIALTWFGADGLEGTTDDVNRSIYSGIDGNYRFGQLPGGDYRVSVAPTVSGQVDGETANRFVSLTAARIGGDTAADSDVDSSSGKSTVIRLGRAANIDDIDIGVLRGSSSIGDRVWIDSDGDGIQDAAETATATTQLSLEVVGVDTTRVSTTTNGTGRYRFDELPPGRYRVIREYTYGVVPYSITAPRRGSDARFDSDFDATGKSEVIVVGQSSIVTNVDLGLASGASVGDLVWNDTNRDGLKDPDEPPLANVAVQLVSAGVDQSFGTADDVVQTTTSGSDGIYSFAAVADGTYRVEVPKLVVNGTTVLELTQFNSGDESTDSDADPATGQTAAFTLAAGQSQDVDFGYVPGTGSIGDRVWTDSNANGVQDNGEPGTRNVKVSLLSLGDDGLPATTDDIKLLEQLTAADGSYSFASLPAGNYRVEIELGSTFGLSISGAGSIRTLDSDFDPVTRSTARIPLAAGEERSDIDAGIYVGATIGDRVWNDENDNGIQDLGEPGVANIPVTLLGAGPDGNFGTADDTTHTVQTDATGTYLHLAVLPGVYRMQIASEVNDGTKLYFSRVRKDAGTNDLLDNDIDLNTGLSDNFTVVSGEVQRSIDIGVRTQTHNIGDFVWNDLNANGLQDAGEPGVVGVRVELIQVGTNQIIDPTDVVLSTTSGTNGRYLFPNVSPDLYQLRVTPPAGMALTVPFAGDPSLDSDIDPDTQLSQVITSGRLEQTRDIGLYRLSSLTGGVFNDKNRNGVRDLDEQGIGDVELTLQSIETGARVIVRTTFTGSFRFTNLVPGQNYNLIEAQPAAYTNGTEVVGNASVRTGDPDGPNRIAKIILGVGEDAVGYGFAEYSSGTLSGVVYEDFDEDGTQDANEGGISGVQVDVTDDTNTVRTITTDGSGLWVLSGLPQGRYEVREQQPSGYFSGVVSTGAAAIGQVSGDTISEVALDDGAVLDDYRFAEIPEAELTGRVFVDSNGNGKMDSGERGVPDAVVSLSGEVGLNAPLPAQFADSTTTTALGEYRFTGLRAGTYQLTQPVPSGLQDGADHLGIGVTFAGVLAVDNAADVVTGILLRAGERGVEFDFGEAEPPTPTTSTTTTTTTTTTLPGITTTSTFPDATTTSTLPDATTTTTLPDATTTTVSNATTTTTLPDATTTTAAPDATTTTLPELATTTVSGPTSTSTSTTVPEATTTSTTVAQPTTSTTTTTTTTTPGATSTVSAAPVSTTPTTSPPVPPTQPPTQPEPLVTSIAITTAPTATSEIDSSTTTQPSTLQPTTVAPSTGAPTTVTVASDERRATLIGVVFVDNNRNGVRDPDEPVVKDTLVTITDEAGVTVTVRTDASGRFSASVAPGSYRVTALVNTVGVNPSTLVDGNVVVPADGAAQLDLPALPMIEPIELALSGTNASGTWLAALLMVALGLALLAGSQKGRNMRKPKGI